MIDLEMRQAAAERVAEELDEAVRRESAYGVADAQGFDEIMAMTAVAHALATWFGSCTKEQFRDRLQTIAMSAQASWVAQAADRQPQTTH